MAENKSGYPVKDISDEQKIRLEKLEALRETGDPFKITKYAIDSYSEDIKSDFEKYEGKDVTIAGRMMSRRIMGKAAFCHIRDGKGDIQVYVKRDDVGTDEYAAYKKYDVGDIMGIKGFVFKTQTGEISIHAKELTLLAKSLNPLPEKFHGLTNQDLRFRQRYVDLIVNEDVRKNFEIRTKFIKYLRSFLDARGFLEVETPVLNTISGGATARPFITHHNTLGINMYLRIATELNLKRLIVGGIPAVYEIGRIFRNEGMDPKHNPEFTSVELYEAYADFNDMMDLFEEFLSGAAKEILGTYEVEWLGNKVNLAPGFTRMTMAEAVKEHVGIDFMAIDSDEEAIRAAAEAGVEIPEGKEKTWGNALYECFDQKVEEKLIQPTFITMHPVDVSPLAKKSPTDPRLTERFELFICSSEMGNAFSELNDPIDQRERFENEVRMREGGNIEAGMMDEDYINALSYGMPPTGGLGIGIDRCVMMLTNNDSIREVIFFPTMKPLGANAKTEEESAPAEVKAPEVIDFSKVEIEPLFADTVDFETFSKSDFRAVKVKDCVAVPKSKKLLQFTLDDGTGTDRIILSGIHPFYEPEELIGKTCIAIVNLPPRAMMGIESCGMLISAVHKEEGEEKLHLLMLDDHIPAGAKMY